MFSAFLMDCDELKGRIWNVSVSLFSWMGSADTSGRHQQETDLVKEDASSNIQLANAFYFALFLVRPEW